jgi:hypothetical protein
MEILNVQWFYEEKKVGKLAIPNPVYKITTDVLWGL